MLLVAFGHLFCGSLIFEIVSPRLLHQFRRADGMRRKDAERVEGWGVEDWHGVPAIFQDEAMLADICHGLSVLGIEVNWGELVNFANFCFREGTLKIYNDFECAREVHRHSIVSHFAPWKKAWVLLQ